MICNYCGEEREANELISIRYQGKNGEPASSLICKSCRKEYHYETEDDIIEELKQNLLTPQMLVKELDKYIVGQDEAKRAVAVEVYNHYTRIIYKDKLSSMNKSLKKNNVFLTGPTGTGKTLIAETLATKILNVPFVVESATSLTESGYVGNDVESVITSLWRQANMNMNRAKVGMVFIDEVDKIARKGRNMSITRDVSGEGVQQALLKIVEGTKVRFNGNGGRIHPEQPLMEIDTSDILFFCGGAFTGIDEIVRERMKISTEKQIGFMDSSHKKKIAESSERNIRANIENDDLIHFGMIPEFLGRFPVLCNLLPLEKEDLVEILNLDNGILDEYRTMFELLEKNIHFSKEAVDLIAHLAVETQVGARGLRAITYKFMKDLLFNAPSETKKTYKISDVHIKKTFNRAA